MNKRSLFPICISLALSGPVIAQKSIIREVQRPIETYPYSDPDPIPKTGRVYPYFRYDGFTTRSVTQNWNMVELENEYIRLAVMPDMGGKVWEAYEKSENYPFVFTTKAVKFRDIALRGPWTTGGLEFNFGDIGHGTTVSTPVDYFTRTNDDGSVSCFIGATDWSSRTTWRVEVNLQPDKAYFSTRAWWYNNTPVEQEYYHWVNVGFKAEGDLQFIFPGTHHIGHGGKANPWPVDSEGRDISFYRNNNFGSYKSYHIIGKPSNFYGGYWHSDNMGFGRYTPYYEKLGKKIWILGLSQEGERWENLLGDNDGLNVELQSGRLFSQASQGSELTPFKHVGFAPYSADTWTDKWFPVKHTRGMTHASPKGAMNLRTEGEWLKIDWMALENLNDTLLITGNGKDVISKKLVMRPMQIFRDSIIWHGDTQKLVVKIGSDVLNEEVGEALNRPVELTGSFDWESEYGLMLKGIDLGQQKNYRESETYLLKAVTKNPNLIPALTRLSQIRYQQGLYDEAREFAGKALAVNTYDPEANYFWGLSSEKTGKIYDALDGFSVAALSPSFKRAANLRLAWMAIERKDWSEAGRLADKCLENYPPDEFGYNLKALISRKQGDIASALEITANQLERDPLNHISRFEKYMCTGLEKDKKEFAGYIHQELPHETFIEMALQYHEWNLDEEASKLLEMAPVNPIVQLIQSYLFDLSGMSELSLQKLDLASKASPELVFPFRPEMAGMFTWAGQRNPDWKWRYYEALIYWQCNRNDEAMKLFTACGEEPDFVPFYLAKAELFREQKDVAVKSLEKAYRLDPQFWRTAMRLSRFYSLNDQHEKALEVAEKNYRSHPGSFITGLQYAQMLKLNRKYTEALTILSGLEMLPAEGDVNAHTLFRETNILLAIDQMKEGKYSKAIYSLNKAETWPENLFSGEPYFADNRVTRFMSAYCYSRMKKTKEAGKVLDYIKAYSNPDGRSYPSGDLITDLLKSGSSDYSSVTESVLNDIKRDRDGEVLEAFRSIL